ncbi:hypothetical protein [Ferrovibrio terrae]|uniref:hypothetical protein n=1 Tax=Ferrovibrio terrae TaxID=2594003 RepID=UPI00313830A0
MNAGTASVRYPLPWPLRLLVSVGLGAILPLVFFGSILIQTEGHEPRGLCAAVEGDGGTLPLQMNAGGRIGYTCDFNWDLASFYVVPPALLFGMIVFAVWTLMRRRAAD